MHPRDKLHLEEISTQGRHVFFHIFSKWRFVVHERKRNSFQAMQESSSSDVERLGDNLAEDPAPSAYTQASFFKDKACDHRLLTLVCSVSISMMESTRWSKKYPKIARLFV
jgi:hypothetical protein